MKPTEYAAKYDADPTAARECTHVIACDEEASKRIVEVLSTVDNCEIQHVHSEIADDQPISFFVERVCTPAEFEIDQERIRELLSGLNGLNARYDSFDMAMVDPLDKNESPAEKPVQIDVHVDNKRFDVVMNIGQADRQLHFEGRGSHTLFRPRSYNEAKQSNVDWLAALAPMLGPAFAALAGTPEPRIPEQPEENGVAFNPGNAAHVESPLRYVLYVPGLDAHTRDLIASKIDEAKRIVLAESDINYRAPEIVAAMIVQRAAALNGITEIPKGTRLFIDAIHAPGALDDPQLLAFDLQPT